MNKETENKIINNKNVFNKLVVQYNKNYDSNYACITHMNCPDGEGAATIAKLRMGNNSIYLKVFPSSIPDVSLLTNKKILMFDVHPKNLEECKKLEEVSKGQYSIIDHHKTGKELLEKLNEENKFFDMKHSGAYLAWKYFYPNNPVPTIVKYIQDRDIWTNKMPNIDEWVTHFHSLEFDFETYSKYFPIDSNGNYDEKMVIQCDKLIEESIDTGKKMLIEKNNNIKRCMNNTAFRLCEINNKYYMIAITSSKLYQSDIGNLLIRKFPYCDFSIVYYYNDRDNITQFSLRSAIGHTDVSEICKLFGGGGHMYAAGFRAFGLHNMIPCKVFEVGNIYNIVTRVFNYIVTIKKESNCFIVYQLFDKRIANLLIKYLKTKETVIKKEYKIGYLNNTIQSTRIAYYLFEKNKTDIQIVYQYNDIQERYESILICSSELIEIISKKIEKKIVEKYKELTRDVLKIVTEEHPKKLINKLMLYIGSNKIKFV